MEGRRDVLRLGAWCSSPRDIPPEMDLVIPEPETGGVLHEQRTLVYPIHVSVHQSGEPPLLGGNPPPPPSPADDDRHHHRHQRRLPSTSSPATATQEGPVHSRLGPPVLLCIQGWAHERPGVPARSMLTSRILCMGALMASARWLRRA